MLLVLDPAAVPFERIWCDYELFTTVSDPKKMLEIVTMRGKPRLMTERLLHGEALAKKNIREQKFPVTLLSKGLQVILLCPPSSFVSPKRGAGAKVGVGMLRGGG